MKQLSPAASLVAFLAIFGVTFAGLWHMTRPAPLEDAEPEKITMEPIIVTHVPNYGSVPDFTLLDQDENRITKADLAGKLWVASFIFTSCAGTCPVMAGRCQQLQASLPDDTLLVSFSVDPARDTPAVLREWGAKFGRDPAKWSLVTGDFPQIFQLMRKGFELETENPLMHSSGFVLVDRYGNRRGYYEALEKDEMPRLIRDINLVLAEKSPPMPMLSPAPTSTATGHAQQPAPAPAAP